MTSSAIFMGLLGVSASFLPQEILYNAGIEPTMASVLFVQILGALWMGFAMINWMCKEMLIGGIYSQPVATGNLMHFLVGALALIKVTFSNPDTSLLWAATIFYSAFAGAFSMVIFTSPVKKESSQP